jgi:fructokinase
MNKRKTPVIFGEVLFDCFPDGNDVLGGAPFNVAWHLQGFGLNPLMLTAVGKDELAHAVLNAMHAWDMNTAGVQVLPNYKTGQVAVSLENGQPSYDIVNEVAYDHVVYSHAATALANSEAGLIYHGSLATRNAESRQTLEALLRETGLPVFLDVNLRAPWWDKDAVLQQVADSTWVKLNDEELALLSDTDVNVDNIRDVAQTFFSHYPMRQLIVTQGEQGAFVVHEQGIAEGQPVNVSQVVDTVGAGDAFASVMIKGIIENRPVEQSLAQALAFAAKVCEQQGATQHNKALYQETSN